MYMCSYNHLWLRKLAIKKSTFAVKYVQDPVEIDTTYPPPESQMVYLSS